MVDNKTFYDENWIPLVNMKRHGPISRWQRSLILDLAAMVEKGAVHSLLDVGCGEGSNTHSLARYFSEAAITGIDFSSTGITCAQENYALRNITFIHDPDSSYMDGTYDMITCFEVLEHVEDWQGFLDRMAGASARYLLLSFPTGRMRAYEIRLGHVRNFKKNEVEDYLTEIKFKAVRTFYAGFPFYSPLFRDLSNLTGGTDNRFVRGHYGILHKAVSCILYFLVRNLSTRKRHGEQFCGLFERI